ncbi:MAG: cytochrome C [Flavobacteriaceae bacterium]|nr:cytochrome C [Flavobacteriaceae bacterium]|tara:strand:+ start:5218 stop:5607 length:390 start_codon:yes stop_codon:yes gene_type:complete
MRYLLIFFFPFFVFSQKDSLEISIENGRLLYDDFCVRCHLPNGKGEIGIIPPLAESDFLYKHMEESIKALKFGGIDGEIIVNGVKYNSRMEKMGLYDDEIADVMNYILNSWGNKSDKIITEEYVKKLKK